MKRSIYVITIVAILLAFGIYELLAVNSFISNMQNAVGEIYNAFPQTESTITNLTEQITDLQHEWNKRENTLCLLHNHKDLSVTTDTITRLKVSVEQNQYYEAKQDLDLLLTQTTKLKHTMTFSVQNVF